MSDSPISGRPYNRRSRIVNAVAVGFCCISAVVAIGALGLIFGYVIYRGVSSVNLSLFTELPAAPDVPNGGMRNAIAGTFTLILMASCLGIPVGMLCGIYLSEYSRGGWFSNTVRLVVDVLAGVPSIIMGVLGYELLVIAWQPIGYYGDATWGAWCLNALIHIPNFLIGVRNDVFPVGFSAWAGAIALGFMMCPIIARTTEEILKLVPQAYREASIGVGASKFQTLFRVVLPAARAGIITGIMLAVARVAGETAPLLFTALGSDQPIFSFDGHFPFVHAALNEAFPTMTVQIFKYAQAAEREWIRQAWAGMLLLILIVFVFNLAVRYVSRDRK